MKAATRAAIKAITIPIGFKLMARFNAYCAKVIPFNAVVTPVMIEEIAIVIAHANSNNTKLNSLSNDVIRLNGELAMYTTGGKKMKKNAISDDIVKEEKSTETDGEEKQLLSSNIETLDINTDNKKFLEEIADRLYFVSRILKFDPVRVKLELDEIYKGIIKYINK